MPHSPRTAGAYLVALYAHPGFVRLKATEAGCLLAWGQMMFETGYPAIGLQELREFTLFFASVDEHGFGRLLNDLKALRLVAIRDGQVEVIPMATAMQASGSESTRRKQGWEKRRQAEPVKSVAPRPTHQVAQVVMMAPARQDIGASPVAPIAKPVALASLVTDSGVLRIGTSPTDSSSVAVRLECKGDQVAEFTADFVRSMVSLYPGVDIEREMRCAAEWCRGKPERKKTLRGARSFMTGWLSRAHQRRDVTFAVVAASRQGNGFGHGSAGDKLPASGIDDGGDDFGDLMPGGGSPVGQRAMF